MTEILYRFNTMESWHIDCRATNYFLIGMRSILAKGGDFLGDRTSLDAAIRVSRIPISCIGITDQFVTVTVSVTASRKDVTL